METPIAIKLSDDVLEANLDFEERLKSIATEEGIQIDFDPENDMLFLTFGKAREGIMEPTSDEFLYLRLDPESLKIIGLAITAFWGKFLKRNPELKKSADALLRLPALQRRRFVPYSQGASAAAYILKGLVPEPA